MARKVKVGVVGPGTIGHRVVAYVERQPDMEVAGISKTSIPDTYDATVEMWRKGIPLYPSSRKGRGHLEEAVRDFRKGFEELKKRGEVDGSAKELVPGSLPDLLDAADVVVDCSDGKVNGKKMGAANKDTYYAGHDGVKVIFQGGEDADIAPVSFNAAVTYDRAVEVGRSEEPYVRQVSCNTTGLTRILWVLQENYTIDRVDAVLVRRSTDPGQKKANILNSVHLGDRMPSHHGPDVVEVIEGLEGKILTGAMKVTTDQMHAHDLTVSFPVSKPFPRDNYPTEERLRKNISDSILKNRIKVVDHPIDTSVERERARRHERLWSGVSTGGDIFQLIVTTHAYSPMIRKNVFGNDWVNMKIHLAVHQEAIVIPDIIDAIRALNYDLLKVPKEKSLEMTDRSLGLCG